MVQLLSLEVEAREEVGKRRNRRLRQSGKTPAVLYGHKKEVVNLAVATDLLQAALRHGSRFVRLTGAVTERAFIKEVQWNTWGDVALHVDFTRVSEHEHVQLSVPVVLRGEAPGVKDGGVVKQHLHKIENIAYTALAELGIDFSGKWQKLEQYYLINMEHLLLIHIMNYLILIINKKSNINIMK